MAAGWIPKPTMGKDTVGPCAPDCHRWTTKNRPDAVIPEGQSHSNCAELRWQAASVCRLCSKPIGFEVRMYVDPEDDRVLVHALCLERAAEIRS
jgi:hypothetical protein